MSRQRLRVALFGTYPRGVGYPRAQVLGEALRTAGAEVVEIHAELGLSSRGRVGVARGPLRAASFAGRYLLATRKLPRLLREAGRLDVVLVGPTGYLDAILARRILRRMDEPRPLLVFDPFFTLTETLVEDRKVVGPSSLRARLFGWLERKSAHAADALLADTAVHADHFAHTFDFDRARIATVPVGHVGTNAPRPDPAPSPGEPLRALYLGTFIPLHGLETVVRAGELLRKEGIEILLAGEGQELPRILRLVAERAPSAVRILQGFRTGAELEALVSRCKVALGVFGGGSKASRVVPCKVHDALARGTAVVTGDTVAARELLTSGTNALLVPPGDAEALAHALLRLKRDPALLARLSSEGRRLHEERLSSSTIGRDLVRDLNVWLGRDAAPESGGAEDGEDPPLDLTPRSGQRVGSLS